MTRVSLRTRKPVGELSLEDLAAFPVWEYAIDEEGHEDRDETWVRPVDSRVVPKHSDTLVAADFTAACGKQFTGLVGVSTLEGAPEVIQGTILHGDEDLFISNPEASGYRESRKHLLTALHLTEAEMFPVSFQLKVPVAGRAKYSGGVLP
jgi:hypothetical protein